MAFVKKTWVDRIVEFPGRRRLKNVATNEEAVFDVTRNEGTVLKEGDAFCKVNMDDLENRIGNAFDDVEDIMQSLGESVADGKSAIASAITSKGVSTAANATFSTMAANIRAISSALRKASIGTGNSSAARTFSATGIPNWNRLTKDNFVISAGSAICDYSENFNESAGNLTSGISYNSSNGVLSVPQSTRKGHFNSNGKTFDKAYFDYTVYCYYVQ